MRSFISFCYIFILILLSTSLRAGKLSDWIDKSGFNLASRSLPSVQILIGDDGKLLESFSKSVQGSRAIVNKESLFDIASMSKVITALGIQIVLNGSIYDLDSKIGDILASEEAFRDNKNKEALAALKRHSIRELLLHQSTLPEIFDNKIERSTKEIVWKSIYHNLQDYPVSRACKSTLGEGGKPYCYKDIHYILLGRVIEVLSKQSLSDFYNDFIFCPLGLDYQGAQFHESRPIFALSRHEERFEVATDSINVFHKMIPSYPKSFRDTPVSIDEVYLNMFHDPKVKKMGGVAGHAGIISSAAAFEKIIEVFLESRVVENHIIKPRKGDHPTLGIPYKSIYQIYTRDNMSRHGRGLGVDITSSQAYSPSGERSFGKTSFGHTGYTGTSFWVDACTGLYYIFLGNRTHVNSKLKSIQYQRRIIARKTVELYSTKEECKYE